MPTHRTRVRRLPERGRYEPAIINEILDQALIAHVGFVGDGTQPYVIPMAVARDGERLLLHGSSASRLVRTLAAGTDVCVTVTHLDGIVVSRAVFDNSMNYRSVVVLGRARPIVDPEDKLAALELLVGHLLPGRWHEARPPSDQELKATTVLELSLSEASAKIRSGPPADDEKDLARDVWAGVIPLRLVALDPVGDPLQAPGLAPSKAVATFFETRVSHIDEHRPERDG